MFKSPPKKTSQAPSTGGIFVLIAALMTAAFAVNLGFVYHQNQVLLNHQLTSLNQQIERSFKRSIDELNQKFSLLSSHYTQMPAIAEAIERKQRQKLLDLVQKDYQTLRQQEPNLFVMHFINPQNITILRMHKPHSYGDDLTTIRPIVKLVNRIKTRKSGFEPGKNGITYRVTTPIFNTKEEHLGVLEFGIRPSYFRKSLEKNFQVQVRTLVKQSALKALTYPTNFVQAGNHAVISSHPIFEQLSIQADQKQQVIQHNERAFLLISDIYLNSFDGQPIVKFQVLKDISKFYQQNSQQNQLYIAAGLATFSLFLLALFFILNRYQQQLEWTLDHLKKSEHNHKKALKISKFDDLTKTYNRRHFNHVIDDIFAAPATENFSRETYSMIFLDIDYFKAINDNHGHLVGDQVLIILAKILLQYSRQNDQLFRWGGEEFFMLLANTELKEAVEIAERLRATVEHCAQWPEGVQVTISLGVIQLSQDDNPISMQHRLDELLYKAKNAGRNQVKFEALNGQNPPKPYPST